ncbi:Thiol:disulfide interchange protein DsbC [invertebrate metagenome]|uniref:Thiol:disulfide interchange protein DsbC n=1 Tax=invertebrate metagenome TaxID=1711999 RepID=A0A2H9TA10_9ZZZZ
MLYTAKILLLLQTISFASLTFSDISTEPASQKLTPAQEITRQLNRLDFSISIRSIVPSAINNLYSVKLSSGQHIHASSDGRYILIKDHIIDISSGNPVNITAIEHQQEIIKELEQLDKKDLIVFTPSGDVTGVVYAFTDADCSACRKMHYDIPELNKRGIEVRYLAFPREGLNSSGHKKMTATWCADDRKAALTQLEQGMPVEEKTCRHDPVPTHYAVGERLGVTGTPFLVLEDGRTIPGYQPPERLAAIIASRPPASL